MDRKRITFFIENRQIESLKVLSKVTRIKQVEFIREGIDMVLERYGKQLKKAKSQEKGG